jgi:RNA polymerase sigma-70 factor (ECF subfamily)
LNVPLKIKGWLNSAHVNLSNINISATPEGIMTQYIATGKKQYLTLLVEEFNLTLYHYLLSLSDKVTAEDVIQTTWVKVMKAQSKTTPTHVKSWLFTVARNTLIDELRKQKKWQYIEFDDQIPSSQNIEQHLEKENQLEVFNKAILALPYLQREAFIFQQEGFSLLQISELTNESQETIKSRLRYARNYLRNNIGARYEY